jgi:hypothetical protein
MCHIVIIPVLFSAYLFWEDHTEDNICEKGSFKDPKIYHIIILTEKKN